jgi:hypothetical protein
MSAANRINALVCLALAGCFYLFFMTAKHDPALSAVNAFAEDPYDAIGSYGILAAAFLAILSLMRAFRPFRAGTPSQEQGVFLARTQMLVVLAVAVTLGGNIVAMARDPALWIESPDGHELAALLGAMAVLAIAVGALINRSVRALGLRAAPGTWMRAALVILAAAATLAFYPGQLRQSTPGELATVIVGAILLFAPMRFLGMALIPSFTGPRQGATGKISVRLRQYTPHLGFVLLLGVALGFLLVLAELTEPGGGIPLARLARVVSVYVGLAAAGVMLGYAFLGKPLGLHH